MEEFNLKVDKKTDFAILRTEGYINNLGGEKISQEVDKLIEQNITTIIINLEKSTIVNSIGISILIEVIEKLVDLEGKIFFYKFNKNNK